MGRSGTGAGRSGTERRRDARRRSSAGTNDGSIGQIGDELLVGGAAAAPGHGALEAPDLEEAAERRRDGPTGGV